MNSTPQTVKKEDLDPARLPVHVAIILDGNGRWAISRGLSRSEGHKAGAKNLDRLIDFFLTLNIPCISLYAFSTENWKRPQEEVASIWELLNFYFKKRLSYSKEKGIRFKISGDISSLPLLSRQAAELAIKQTSGGEKLTVNFCINYGSRDEIAHACTEILRSRMELIKKGEKIDPLTPVTVEELEARLYTHPLPDVDLLIRPGGEHRISNFLLWQSAYAELYWSDILWPDFSEEHVLEALHWYQNRERRFGGLSQTGEKE